MSFSSISYGEKYSWGVGILAFNRADLISLRRAYHSFGCANWFRPLFFDCFGSGEFERDCRPESSRTQTGLCMSMFNVVRHHSGCYIPSSIWYYLIFMKRSRPRGEKVVCVCVCVCVLLVNLYSGNSIWYICAINSLLSVVLNGKGPSPFSSNEVCYNTSF